MDGVLTYTGVMSSGSIDIEGNIIVHWLMKEYGPSAGLVIAKMFGCILIFLLYKISIRNDFNCTILNIGVPLVLMVYTYIIFVWIYFLL